MALTVASLQTSLNTYLGDTSTDRVSAVERLAAITEATVVLAQEINNDHQLCTAEVDFFDSVNYYKTTTTLADMVEPGDLVVKDKDYQDSYITRKSPKELRVMIGNSLSEESYAVERRDTDSYLIINHASRYSAKLIAALDTLTEDGAWAVDSTNSDATNLTADAIEYKQGSGSLNFDITNYATTKDLATIINSTLSAIDLTDYEDLASWLMWIYLPDVSNFTSFDSVTLYWGTDSSNYWSATVTTDIDGSAFADGWNQIQVNWSDAAATSSPDITDIGWLRIDFNYTTPAANDTDFRVDDLRLVRPETLVMHYLTWNVGTDTTGASDLTAFTATTDIPFFSGQYDHYKWYVAHKATGILFRAIRNVESAEYEEREAQKYLQDLKRMFPTALTPEVKSFKVRGVSFTRRK